MNEKNDTEERGFEFEDFKRGVRLFLQYAKRYQKKVVIAGILAIVSAVLLLVFPKISGNIIDNVIAAKGNNKSILEVADVMLALGLYFLVRIAGAFVGYAYMYRIKTLGIRLEYDYLTDMFAHILRLPFAFLRNQKTGAMISKIEQAANALDVGIGMTITRILPAMLTTIGVIIFAGLVQWSLAGVLLLVVVLHVLVIRARSGILSQAQKKTQIVRNKVKGETYDALYNAEIVKYSNAIESETIRIKNNNDDWYREAAIFQHHGTINYSIRIVLRAVSYGMVLLVCSQLVLTGVMSPGEFVTFLLYLQMMLEPMRIIFWAWDQVQDKLLALRFSEEIRKEKQELSGGGEDVLMGDIEFSNVSFEYPEAKGGSALSGLSCIIKEGETVALVGRSGSGKSTFVNLIMGYFNPTEGVVSVGGIDVSKADTTKLRALIGVVPQDISLFNQTVKANISYGKNASDEVIEGAAEKAHALEFIKEFPDKWEQKVGEKGTKLSGGQKQRIALARAIVQDPYILILDEPTSALDAQSEHHIEKALDGVMNGKTTIIIAHRLRTVRRADRIFVMEKGRIIERGSHKQLMLRGGAYSNLYNLQVELH